MNKKFFSLIFVCCFACFAVKAQNIPTPKEHFGFNMGDDYQLANYTQTEAYFKKLAATSPRVKLVDIGKTEQGRTQWMLIVSSPENLKNLDRYKAIAQQLAHAENLTDSQALTLAAEGKAVVWIDGGLHATEVVGAHQLIETAYQLSSRQDAETIKILNDVIVLLTHANPDGQELVSNWYMREPVAEKRLNQYLPELYEKYAGHDNNRDFYMFNLKETQNMGRQLFIEWLPQIMYNHHQAGPAGSVVAGPPFRDPFNYVFDPLVMTSLDAVGAAMVNRLNAEGKPGYTERSGSVYSTWYNGGLRTATYFHNMIGLLTEIIGGPNPAPVPVVPERLIPSSATSFPVLPQTWHFRQSIDYSVSLNYGVLEYASRHRDELLFNIYKMGRHSIEKGEKDNWTLLPKRSEEINNLFKQSQQGKKPEANTGDNYGGVRPGRNIPVKLYDSVYKNPAYRDPRGYIISSGQTDFPTAARFINTLITSGIEVEKATADFTVNGKQYPAGSYIVKTSQAFRPHILDMFEPQDHPNDFEYPGGPPIAPYDAAGWTLAYQMGIQFDRVLDAFDGPFERIPYGELQSAKGSAARAGSGGYLLNAAVNNSFIAVNDLLKAGVDVYRTSDSVYHAFAKGSFYIPGSSKAKTILDSAAALYGINVVALSKKPSGLTKIGAARIALWDRYGGSMPSGWTRWIFEKFHFNADIIYAKNIDSGNLKSRYDVIVFVDGAIPAPNDTGRRFFEADPKPDSIPAAYRNRLGRITADTSIPQLKKFLEDGGAIITIGSSTALAYHLKLPVHNALTEIVNGVEKTLPGEKFYIPGSILRVKVDSTEKAAYGMASQADVYFDASPVFHILPEGIANKTIQPVAWFEGEQSLRSGWAWGQSYLNGGVTAFQATVGKGVLYAFGPEITFRAQPYGTFRFLFNGLYK
ncbi:M14 metallopeptidase family protein [Parafilimonas sp.]|uniref:M14 family metallopeptidase n=1 Tax=Parafilimonas sp. TaxID=1969739 RepID=UPI0039E2512F